jgi:hypothetical protein
MITKTIAKRSYRYRRRHDSTTPMIEKKIEGETIGKTCCNLCTRSTKQPKRAYFRYCRRKENSFPAFGFFKSYRTDMHLRTAMVVWLRPDFASFALHAYHCRNGAP